MAYSNISDTQLLDPTTGRYYTEQVYTPQNYGSYNPLMGGNSASIAYNIMSNNPMMNMPQTRRNYTGDVSQVWKTMQNRQPYQYNVPSLASMFPSMAMPTMNNMQPMQYTGGAGQFLSGLLGNAPMINTAANPTTPTAPMAQSSGAGRFV